MPIKIRNTNWLNETPKKETERRLHATEASVAEAHIRINQLENLVMRLVAKVEGTPEPEPEE